MKRIFAAGYYGFGNTGDEAILASMTASLREIDTDLAFTVTSGDPAATEALHGVEAVRWTDVRSITAAVRSADLVLVGGGGIFHDYWGFDANAFLTPNHSNIGFYTAPAVLGRLYGRPVMLYAVGVGPLRSEHGACFTRVACECAQVVTVRDEASRDDLVRIGVPAGRIAVTADPVWAYNPPLSKVGEAMVSELPRPVIGVSVRHWDVGVHPALWEAELATALDYLLASTPGASVAFVPFQAHTGERENDSAVAARIRDRMRHAARASLIDPGLSPQDIRTFLAGCQLVVGMRLHALILAASAGVPVVGLEYDRKVCEALRQIGSEEANLRIDGLEARRAFEAFRRKLEGEHTPNLLDVSERVKGLAQTNARLAIDLLRNPEPDFPPPSADLTAVLSRGVGALVADTEQWRLENLRLRPLATQNESLAQEINVLCKQFEDERNAFRKQLEDTTNAFRKQQQETREQAAIAARQAAAFAEVAAENESLRRQVERAEESRRNVLGGIDKFRNAFAAQADAYRRERAYQIMLWVRKAYTILMHRGGLSEFVPWAFRKGRWGLGEVDLVFPDVWTHLPQELEQPLTEAGASPDSDGDSREGGIANPGKYDVIVLAVFNFEFRYQRPQQIATHFARLGHRVFWVSPGRLLPPDAEDAYETLLLRENLWEIHMRTGPIELYTGELTSSQAESIHECLSALYRDFHIAESCTYLQFPFWAETGFKLREAFGSRVLYDCMDDWQNWTAEPVISRFNLEEEKRLAKEADVIVATSQDLADRFAALGAKPVLARNGADYDFFASPRETDWLEDLQRPIIGYYGAIADWFDIKLVTEVAKLRPQYTFAFIGHVYKIDVAELEGLSNVRMLGEKNYRDLPQYLSKFDVCLVPFVLNQLTKAVDPVKMYEYLSQAKPVIATAMTELEHLDGEVLYIGRGPEDFAAKIDLALQEKDSPELKEKRLAFAASNTWAKRVEPMDAALQASFPKVSILLVTYNCEEFLGPCLDSIERNTAYPVYEVVIVDNASNDRTRKLLKEYAAKNPRIRLTLLDRNAGFAGANNIAARESSGEYLVFLNPDTIVTPGWLNRMTNHFRRDSKMGLVCAVTNFSGNETKIDFDYANGAEMERFALRLAWEKRGQALDLNVVPLFAVMTTAALWRQVGELDECFEVGMFEDDDLSWRFRKAGYRVVAAEDCFIHHFGNGSFAKLPSEESVRIFERNRARFQKKWGVEWIPHKLRSGVRAPYEDRRFHPIEFSRNGTEHRPRKKESALRLRRVFPASCSAGTGFNVQPVTGYSAVAVECRNATPTTVIALNGVVLHTNYAGQKKLTALVPPHLYAEPGVMEVYLLNDFGESNRLRFVVS